MYQTGETCFRFLYIILTSRFEIEILYKIFVILIYSLKTRNILLSTISDYQHSTDLKRFVIDGTRAMGHCSNSEVEIKFGISVRPFHECTYNNGYAVKHRISYICLVKRELKTKGISKTAEHH